MFAQRLTMLRLSKDLTHRQMADVLGITRQAYGNYESGKREPNFEAIHKLASFFNVPTDYLLEHPAVEQPPGKNFDLLSALENNEYQLTAGDIQLNQDQLLVILRVLDTHVPKKHTVPILGIIHSGIPLLSRPNIIGDLDIAAYLEGHCDFALYVQGDSMIGAGISDHDLVICIADRTPHHGDIVIALVNGDQTNPKYYIDENAHPLLRAANPDYADIEFKAGDEIQGRVVKVLKEPPPVNIYRDYRQLRQEQLVDWREVIEEAVAGGLQPGFVKQFVESQIKMAAQLAKQKAPR